MNALAGTVGIAKDERTLASLPRVPDIRTFILRQTAGSTSSGADRDDGGADEKT